tara:strand:- start:350 stop:1129 length:780 start_codon:yes stop_codon:yes gene_type:complete
MIIYFSVDVEKDLHMESYKGVLEGIPRLLKILDEFKIKGNFFVTGEVIEKYPKIIKEINKRGHEVGIHGYSHKRFDSMKKPEKLEEINKSMYAFKKVLGKNPKGFRAPQHSIDKESLRILEKKGFVYDSSECSGNIMLLRHLLKKNSNKKSIINNFFGKTKSYQISKNFHEIPRASPFIALGGFELKVYPFPLIEATISLHEILGIPINFVMHSWDLINIPKSKTSKICSPEEFEHRLKQFLGILKNRHSFKMIGETIK